MSVFNINEKFLQLIHGLNFEIINLCNEFRDSLINFAF